MKGLKPKSVQTLALMMGGLWGVQDLQPPPTAIMQTARPVLVAVIDTGIDAKHPELSKNLWRNPGETGLDKNGQDRATNGLDDDGNGYVDDVYGWDFVHGNAKPIDNHGHGTHIAGLIHQLAPKARLMVLKYYDPKLTAQDTIRYTAQAFDYAVRMGAKIINYSGGGNSRSFEEFRAVRDARARGVLVVAAAGNEGQNADITPYFPANYSLSHILAVTAHGPSRQLLPTSNFGVRSVDLSAPGEDIWSTMPGGGYGLMTGTSQATALASGVAALTYGLQSELKSPEEMIRHLRQTGVVEESFEGKTRSATRLNALRSATQRDRTPERRIENWQENETPTINRQPSSPASLKDMAAQISGRLSRPLIKTPTP